MLAYSGHGLNPIRYTDFNLQFDYDFWKSMSGSVFTLGSGVVLLRSVKQFYISDSTIKAEYVTACKGTK